jgi:uncharacterized protein
VTTRDRASELVAGGLAALEDERGHINDLNVYPVPDGDTGTNMALTTRSVLEALEAVAGGDLAEVSAVIAKGALMGARGNSGVILSQIVRGACEAIGAAETPLDTVVAQRAFDEASEAAYRAVKQPVEGTMLSVIREMAQAVQTLPPAAPLRDLAAVAVQAGKEAVERTPEQLEALSRAGVVDAGGYGLLVLFEGIVAAAFSSAAPRRVEVRTVVGNGTGRHVPGLPDDPDETSAYRYCTSFLLSGVALDRVDLERFVAGQGDSWLVVGDETMLKVHVHTDHPGTVLGYASAQGEVDAVEVNDMYEQTRARSERLSRRREGTGVIAVAAGDGNRELFHELGCDAVVDGGQSMNPSAAQIIEAIEETAAAEVVILPNNKNIVLTAEQAAAMCERPVEVVATRSMPAGLAAMVAYDPAAGAAVNAAAMDDVVRGVRSAEITFAVRDSEIDGTSVRRGEILGLVDGRLLASGDDLGKVFGAILGEFARGAAEVVTVLTSLNGSTLSTAELQSVAEEALPEADVEFHEGGQPLYPILVGAE